MANDTTATTIPTTEYKMVFLACSTADLSPWEITYRIPPMIKKTTATAPMRNVSVLAMV